MKLSRDEDIFLRHWIYDEMHFRDGAGPAKRLQVAHRVAPFNISILIAAAMPDQAQQEAAGTGPPPADPPAWPWPNDDFERRLVEARSLLAERLLEGADAEIIITNQAGLEKAIARLRRTERALNSLRHSDVIEYDKLTKSYRDLIDKLKQSITAFTLKENPPGPTSAKALRSRKCPVCKGKKMTEYVSSGPNCEKQVTLHECQTCNGTGFID